jgi:hypothetical protein
VAETLVAMLVVCESSDNRLNHGLNNILEFVFSKFPKTKSFEKKLIGEFQRELGKRLEDDVGMDILVLLGVNIDLNDLDNEENPT